MWCRCSENSIRTNSTFCKALQCKPDRLVFGVIPHLGGNRLFIQTEYGYDRFELRFHSSYFRKDEMQRLLDEFSEDKKILLVAKHISRHFGEQLSQKGVAFVDLAGNMNLLLTDHDAGRKKRCCLYILGKPPRRKGAFEGAAQPVVTEVV